MSNQHPPLLSFGSQGSDVERLQQELAALGYRVTVTGNFDTNTEAAVKKFQTQYNLKVDGIVGAQTGQQLDMVLQV